MPVDQQELFSALLADSDFAIRLKSAQLSLHLVQHDPDRSLFVSPEGVVDGPPPALPTLRLEFSGGTADRLWAGRLPLMVAVVNRELTVKGPVSRVRQLAELLPAIGAKHTELSA